MGLSKGIMISTQPLLLSFMLSSPARNLLMFPGALQFLCETQWWALKSHYLGQQCLFFFVCQKSLQQPSITTPLQCKLATGFKKGIFKMPNKNNLKTRQLLSCVQSLKTPVRIVAVPDLVCIYPVHQMIKFCLDFELCSDCVFECTLEV